MALVYNPPPFDGRIGIAVFTNSTPYPLTITLWHPDSRSPWRSWIVAGGATETLVDHNGQPANFGSNWGAQLGETIKPLQNIQGAWTGHSWIFSSIQFWSN